VASYSPDEPMLEHKDPLFRVSSEFIEYVWIIALKNTLIRRGVIHKDLGPNADTDEETLLPRQTCLSQVISSHPLPSGAAESLTFPGQTHGLHNGVLWADKLSPSVHLHEVSSLFIVMSLAFMCRHRDNHAGRQLFSFGSHISSSVR
jgi:hypothetical protein